MAAGWESPSNDGYMLPANGACGFTALQGQAGQIFYKTGAEREKQRDMEKCRSIAMQGEGQCVDCMYQIQPTSDAQLRTDCNSRPSYRLMSRLVP